MKRPLNFYPVSVDDNEVRVELCPDDPLSRRIFIQISPDGSEVSHLLNPDDCVKLANALVAEVDDVGRRYRRPFNPEEALFAHRKGVLERCMDGIDAGPQGWHKNKLSETHILQGLGSFRVPVDWASLS